MLSDHYFDDVSSQITESDRIKAGYRIHPLKEKGIHVTSTSNQSRDPKGWWC